MLELKAGQLKAISNMKNGCILAGKVGSGKTLTSIGYYWSISGGKLNPLVRPNKFIAPLIIITTAKVRNTNQWKDELDQYGIDSSTVIIDSWNNLYKYENLKDYFFIFDEKHSDGTGKWAKAFLKIAKFNKWIILSGTPGDAWPEYETVFVANGFYKSRTEMRYEHYIYQRGITFPKIIGYYNEQVLEAYRASILVELPEEKRPGERHRHYIDVPYNYVEYRRIVNERDYKDEETGKMVAYETVSEYCAALRKLVNTDPSRLIYADKIITQAKKIIIFYNLTEERNMLMSMHNYVKPDPPSIDMSSLDRYRETKEKYDEWCALPDKFECSDYVFAEYNGKKHEPIPEGDNWVYLVQFNACEGWNCITCNNVLFYSMSYSYKIIEQAEGRIDRMNTPFKDLHYYYFRSPAPIDRAAFKAYESKRIFNVVKYIENRQSMKSHNTITGREFVKDLLKEQPLPSGYKYYPYDDDFIVNENDGTIMSCKRLNSSWEVLKPQHHHSGGWVIKWTDPNGNRHDVSPSSIYLTTFNKPYPGYE